jgi:hypothetical protein
MSILITRWTHLADGTPLLPDPPREGFRFGLSIRSGRIGCRRERLIS